MDTSMQGQSKKTFWILFISILFVGICIIAWYITNTIFLKKITYREEIYYTIKRGDSLQKIANDLEKNNIIANRKIFYYTARLFHMGNIKSGEYLFKDTETLWNILTRLENQSYGYEMIQAVIPEGYTNKQISIVCATRIPKCDKYTFDLLTKNKEGYLFPATYAVSPSTTTEQFIKILLDGYTTNTFKINKDIHSSSYSEKDILILASIIEREAGKDEEKPIIAGILLKRLHDNFPLQVDAPFYYLYQKKSSELSLSDLRAPSPYNTYIHTGLPPTPIGNPGLASIMAVLNPTVSPYYFYLHGNDGTIHYGKTYREHIINQKKYIQ